MKRALPQPYEFPLARQTLLTLLAGLAAGLAVTAYLLTGGELLRFVLAFLGALLTAASLERSGVGTVRRWTFALPVGLLVYVLLLSLR